jgi:hypothetical protein
VVNDDNPGAPFAETGPNLGRGARPRGSELGVPVTAVGVEPVVLNTGPAYSLGSLSQWAGAHAPTHLGHAALWHLLTDAYPAPGTTGLAAVGVACSVGSNHIVYTDQGTAAAAGSFPRTVGGNSVYGGSSGASCPSGSAACVGNTGLSSRSSDVWLTIAHELGHGLGGGHTFAQGGRMSYTGETPFAPNTPTYSDICTFITEKISTPQNCFVLANPVYATTTV